MGKKLVSITGLAMILAIVLAVNLIATALLRNMKFDMTEEKLFTLSDGAKKTLASLEDNISAKFYYSKTAIMEMQVLKTYAERVLEMLREFEGISGGKFMLEVLDPRPDTETEEWADRYGLQGIPVGSGDRIFLGLVLKDESGRERSIPFFHPDREPTLEYDIAKAVYSVSRPERKRIGVLSSLDVMGEDRPMNPMMQREPPRPWMFIRGLREHSEVERISTDATEIPDGLDLLLVIHPHNFSAALRYGIDQYVLKGGRALVFVDPMCQVAQESAQMPMQMEAPVFSNMPDLLAAWGLALEGARDAEVSPAGFSWSSSDAGKVVADPQHAYQNQQTGETVIVLLTLGEKNRNADEIITSGLENIWMFCAGGLKKINTSDEIEIVPLLESSDRAAMMDGFSLQFGLDPGQLIRDFTPGSSRIALAYKVSGRFKTAFPDGKPKEENEEADSEDAPEAASVHLKESVVPGTVIVVSDVDIISDPFSIQVNRVFGQEFAMAINDNQVFLSNAVENLTGSSDLIGLRSRGRSQRPFTRVREIELAAQEQWLEKERALNAKLQAANQRLDELQRGTQERRIIDAAFAKEIEEIREERLATQRELRDVRRRLREDVEALAFKVKAVNIALLPMVVVAAGASIGVFRSLRKRKP